MNPQDSGIRKAAVLVAALEKADADAVLDALAPEQARRVRQVVVELGRIDPQEQRMVIEEFFRAGPMPPEHHPMVPEPRPPGIELDGRLARRLATRQTPFASDEPAPSPPTDTRPFHFLHETQGEKLAAVLANERPQAIALVLSHLPPERAGNVLARLRPAVQVDVVHRLVDLEEADPVVLRDVERALESRLCKQVHMQRRRTAGLKAVSDILDASDVEVGMQILENVAAHDRALAEKLGSREPEFDDLARLDDAALAAVFAAAEPELAMTALVGAPPQLIDRVLRRLAAPEAEIVRHKLNHPGPIRLSDVEGAQHQVASLCRRLAREGHIQLPPPVPIPAA